MKHCLAGTVIHAEDIIYGLTLTSNIESAGGSNMDGATLYLFLNSANFSILNRAAFEEPFDLEITVEGLS